MNWGNEKQRDMKVKFLLEQYAFLKDPKPVVPYLPDAIDIDISNRCNIRCISCFHSIKKFKPFKDMTLDTLRTILDQAEGNASTITIGNHGEPFLHKDVFTMIKEIKERGFFLNVINNGTLLTADRVQRLLDIGVDRVAFSLDSVDPDIYPQLRPGARLEVTLSNVLNFLRLNFEQGLKVYVNISTVNTELSFKSKIGIFEYFSRLPVHVIYTSDLLNFHDMLSIREETKFFKKYKDITDPDRLPICLNGFDRLLLRPNGNVSLCAIDWDSVHVLGNVHDAPYTELWNNEKAQEFRIALIEKDYSTIEKNGVLCSKCDGKWVQNTSKHQGWILTTLAGSLEDAKKELDKEINTSDRYENLLEELHRVEK